MKTKYKEIDLKLWSAVLKRHAWWVLLLVIGVGGFISIDDRLSEIRSAEDDVKKRQLGENLLKLFNYLPNQGEDSVKAEDVFCQKGVIKDYYLIQPTLNDNLQKRNEIVELYPFLGIIQLTQIDSIKDFDNDRVVLYYKHFDYTALAGADTLRLFPKLYKCIDGSNILQFRNFQIFSYFCDIGLPYRNQMLQYQYRKIKDKFYCEKYLFD